MSITVCADSIPVYVCAFICRCISLNIDGITGCTRTCWCSILMSATSLWSSSCSLLSSSQACFTWLCSLTNWMLSCRNASSFSFSWVCSLARWLWSVLRRYHKYNETVGTANYTYDHHYSTCSQANYVLCLRFTRETLN